jgi:4-hydroxy-tetrahydrodipicolinate reductase
LRGAPPFAMTGAMRTADPPIRISLFAPEGRMGKAIARAAAEATDVALDQDHADVLIDFSAPDALRESLGRALAEGIPILVGTTGLGPDHRSAITEAAKTIAVI